MSVTEYRVKQKLEYWWL